MSARSATSATAPAADPIAAWQRAAGGIVGSASMQAEAAAARRAALASRIVRAGLRAQERALDQYDAEALNTLVRLLEAVVRPDAQAAGPDVYAFAAATFGAAM